MTLDEIKAALAPLTTAQRIRVAIRAAQVARVDFDDWDAWAEGWLSGADRSTDAADAAALAVARGRLDAPFIALPADAAWAAWRAAGTAATSLIWWAAWAVKNARRAVPDIDLAALIAQAIEEEPA